jgi:hypothetical protein
MRLSELPQRAAKALRFAAAASALFALSVGLMPRPILAQDTPDTTTYTITKRLYKAKDLDRYKIAVTTSMDNPMGGQLEIKVSMLIKETVQEVKEDGSLTLIHEFEQAAANIMGMDQDITSFMPKVTQTRDKNGKIDVKVEGGNEQAAGQVAEMIKGMARAQTAFYPDKPVKIGDSYKVSYKGSIGPGQEADIKGDAKVVAVETISGIKTLKIKITSTSASSDANGAAASKSEGTCNLDIKTGKIVRMASKIDGTANGGKTSTEINYRLVLPEEKEVKAPAEKK